MNRRSLLKSLAASAWVTARSGGAQGKHSPEAETVAREVRPEQLVIVYRSSFPAEEAAADELAHFMQRLTGALPDIVDEAKSPVHPGGRVLFLVGRTLQTKLLLSRGVLEDPAHRDHEAYQVRSLNLGTGQALVLLGGSGIATLYAVYHYLEQFCGVGYFWDGDHVPQRATLPVSGAEVTAEPRFKERVFFNGCNWFYTVPWWDWDEWKHYLDWMVKSRLNIVGLTNYSPGANAVWEEVWKKFEVPISDSEWAGVPYDLSGAYASAPQNPPPSSETWREGRAELHARILKYARSRGMRTVVPEVAGLVPEAFPRIFPKVKTLKSSWSSSAPLRYLDPSGETYHRVGRAFLEAYLTRFGTDHLYGLANLGELQMAESREEEQRFALGLPKANFEVIETVDPKAIGILPGWTFLGKDWPIDLVRQCIEQLPSERVRVLDFYAEQCPLHKETNYFFGAPWQFGVLHAFGGEMHLHGNMPLLQRQLRTVAADPSAARCVGFALTNEVSGHNYFYYQFACKLGWNPREVELGSYLRAYAERRYGPDAAPALSRALEELLASVYGSDEFARPLYWHRLGSHLNANLCEGTAFIPHLRRAVQYALKAGDDQRNNPLYLHDLNDMMRQYLAQLFNAHVMALIMAFRREDRAAFARESAQVGQLIEAIEDLLRQDDYYWLTPSILKARRLPGAPADVGHRVADVLTLWAGVSGLRDYACRDTYEMVRYYYRPRIAAFIEELQRQMDNRQRYLEFQPGQVRLEARYDSIEQKWVREGFPLVEEQPNPPRVLELARTALERFHEAENV
jgi:alpha-N-acetylglucosaminidase